MGLELFAIDVADCGLDFCSLVLGSIPEDGLDPVLPSFADEGLDCSASISADEGVDLCSADEGLEAFFVVSLSSEGAKIFSDLSFVLVAEFALGPFPSFFAEFGLDLVSSLCITSDKVTSVFADAACDSSS